MSIRTGTEAPAALERNGDEQDTFQNMLSIQIDQPGIGSMSISPANRDVALGSRDGLYILDLQNPYDPPRFLPFYSPWEIADVQWSPWASRSHWVVSTSNQKAVVYNLSLSPSLSASPIEYTLHAHTRGITDINWNSKHPDLLATCGLDGWIWSWDLRTGRRPAWGVCAWGSGATQVKWNRVKSNMIASAHDSRVLIWDDRMGAVPVSEIQAHSAKIYGIDWSRRKSSDLITCSLDKSFKYWSMDKCTTPLLTVQTASPVFRARYLPFGRGVLTLPQRSDHALSIWGRTKIEASNTAQPVARFEGAREGIKEFVWRTRGGSDIDYDDRQFQLVTWSKDRRLRLWPISDEIMREVEHVKGAPITVQMTRRNCPDISYRTFAEAAVLPTAYFPVAPIPSPLAPARPSVLTATISASPARPSLLTSSLLTAGFATPFASPGLGASHADSAKRRGAAMMTTHKARNRTQRASDRLAWMEGVKVIKPYVEGEDNYEGRMVTLDREDEVVPSAELQPADAIGMQDGGGTESRSSSVPRGTDAGTAREGGETEMGGSVLLDGRSKATGTVKERDGGYVNLGEEITSIVRRFSRVNFEKVHVAGRTCTVSLYSPVFLRATFTFPKSYPTASAVIELERNADSSLKTRAFILQSVRKLMASRAERGLPSFELALRFLLGDRSDMETKKAEVQVNEDEDDEDDEGVSAETGGIAYNVPPPRRGGAVFSPRGQLVVFFPTDIFAAAPPVKTAESSVLSPQTVKPGLPRLTDSFGAFFAFGGTVDEDYVETDEALQCASTMAPRARRGSDVQIEATPRISSTVHIKDLTHLTLVGQDRVICSLRTPPLESARQAAKDALADGDAFLARVWSTLATLLADMSEASAKALETAVSERVLREMLYYLRTIGDLQVMGVIACLLESHRRSFVVKLPRRTREPATPTDYFNHHTPRSADSPYDRTPLASGYRASRSAYSEDRVNSPRPSWTNLTAFFNHSVLSLRSSGGASGPGSPDQLYFPHSPNVPTRPPALYSAQLSPPIARSLELTNHRRNSPSRYASRSPDGRNSSADGREALKRARTSPNVTFGKTSIALISGKPIVLASREVSANSASKKRITVKVVDYVQSHRYGPWWLSDEVQGELEVVRLQYAELLYRWGQNLERVEVLKLCRSAHASHPAGAYAKSLLREASGMGDKSAVGVFSISRTLKCSICHLPVTNLSQNCTVCYHSTHLSCAQKWWAAEQECASGCGCRCVESGGTSGSFLATQVVPAPPIIAKPWGASRLPFFA